LQRVGLRWKGRFFIDKILGKEETMARHRDDRPRFGDRDPGSSGLPMVTILGLALGIPTVLIVCCGGCGFLGWWAVPSVPQMAVNPPAVDGVKLDGKPAPFVEPPPDPNAFVPAAIAQPPEPTPQGKRTIDLIPMIQPSKDAVHGRWGIRDKVLHCNDQHLVPRIEIPYQPPAEYDFVVTFSQPALRNGISLVMPKQDGGQFFWFIGSGNGTNYGFGGNPNREGRTPGLIEVRTPYTTVVQVRKQGVRGMLNGKELITHKTDYRDLTMDDWRKLRDPRCLGVCCDDPTVFHYVRLVEISGTGKKLR
jgi:hypothetical protein